MNEYSGKVTKVQERLNSELKTGSISVVIKECEKQKGQYEQTMGKVKRTSEDIQNYIDKFDKVKEEINDSGAKYEKYKMEIDEKKL